MKYLPKQAARRVLRRMGYDVVPTGMVRTEFPLDFDSKMQDLCRQVGPFTMTSPERIFAVRQSVDYIVRHRVPGEIVECGVWKGGSMMVVARTLLEIGEKDRVLRMFDTFEGMTKPSAIDIAFTGDSAGELMERSEKDTDWVWAYSPLEEVQKNMQTTGYPSENTIFVKGKVEATIPQNAPKQIALLRLDTDWYESTYHELKYLYPRLSPGGVLIIDDYGHWEGARRAVDQYFAENHIQLLLNRIDYTGRVAVKCG